MEKYILFIQTKRKRLENNSYNGKDVYVVVLKRQWKCILELLKFGYKIERYKKLSKSETPKIPIKIIFS